MAENKENNNRESSPLFRQSVLDRISSPEQLTDYLKVTSAGIWIILVAIIMLLIGLVSWACIGTLTTTSDVYIDVTDHQAEVRVLGAQSLEEGMVVETASVTFVIASIRPDSHGGTVGIAEVALPDGEYDGTVITETFHPIEFLLKGD